MSSWNGGNGKDATLLDDKRCVTRCHYVLFAVCMLDLSLARHLILLQNLQRKSLFLLVLDEFHAAETTDAQCANDFQIGKLNVIVFCDLSEKEVRLIDSNFARVHSTYVD